MRAAGPFDPRIPRAAWDAAATHGQRTSVILDGVYDASPGGDVMAAWDRLPQPHRDVAVVEWAMGELYNGTLVQYFANSTGEQAALLPDAARRLGAERQADLFARALAFFDIDRVHDRDYRNDRIDELEAQGELPALEAVTDEFYALEDDGDVIWGHLDRCVEAHPGVFFT